MTAAERLAASKRIEEAVTPGVWVARGDRLTKAVNSLAGPNIVGSTRPGNAEFIAHARTELPVYREALEAVMALHTIEEYSGGGPESSDGAICFACSYELDADESCCPTVRLIESALTEKGDN